MCAEIADMAAILKEQALTIRKNLQDDSAV
jgi:hypothetical protein